MKILFVFFSLMLSFSLFANTYEKAFQELCATSVSQFDFNISKLNSLLNDETNGIKRKRKIRYSKTEDNMDFGLEYSISIYNVQSITCFKDTINPMFINCEITLSPDDIKTTLPERVKKFRGIYQEVLSSAQFMIHPSFDPAYLKVIIKKEKETKVDAESFINMEIDIDFLRSIPTEYEILVVWEKGVPLYQDAFFH
jgi:hypothetical protein